MDNPSLHRFWYPNFLFFFRWLGQFVMQYLWSGYYDCVDINLLAVQSTDIFGMANTETGYDRMDHCYVTSSLNGYSNYGCMEISNTDITDACASVCTNQPSYNTCDGFEIFPFTWPSSVKFPIAIDSACSSIKPTMNSSQLCAVVKFGTIQVGPTYKVVSDPGDAAFYSSCYIRKAGWVFAQTCPACVPPLPSPTFRFGDSCIDCFDMSTFSNPAIIPVWALASTCQDCLTHEGY